MTPCDGLSREEQDHLDEVRIACPDIATACDLVCVFTGLVRDRLADARMMCQLVRGRTRTWTRTTTNGGPRRPAPTRR